MEQKVTYYTDELNDEFSTAVINPRKIDENYTYIQKGLFRKITRFILYRVIATPLGYIYMKAYFRHKIVNKSILQESKKTGYFLYGNHTHFMADALIPTLVSTPKDTYVVVHPNNVSMPILGRLTPSMGALPLPDNAKAAKNFVKAIETITKNNHCIMIYPEAHIWPYYTDIRPFKDLSFKYPVTFDKPVYCFTNTYQKTRFVKRPRIVTYVDGPFFADKAKTMREQKKELRNQVYETMKSRAENNNVVLIKYEKRVKK